MSKLKVLVAVLAVVALSLPTAAFAMGVPPAAFIGTAYLDGEPAAGKSVTAWIKGDQAGKAITEADGDFYLLVAGDPGDVISFKVAGIDAVETAIWTKGETRLLDLHAVTPPIEAVDPQPLIKLSPISGWITTVSGYGFTPGSVVTITWNGTRVPTIPKEIKAAIKPAVAGRFTAVVVAPVLVPGTYIIRATDGVNADEATFVVLAGPAGPPGPVGPVGPVGPEGGVVWGIIALIVSVLAIILVFVFKPKAPTAS
jgi:hypothetical protein